MLKHSEKMNQMLVLQDKLGIKVRADNLQISHSAHSLLQDLVEPSRSFIRTGLLQLCQLDQTSLFKKDIVSYWFFLFNDLLLWAERKGSESYQLLLGGSGDENTTQAKIAGPGFDEDGIVDAVERTVEHYRAVRQPNERFIDTYRRVGMDGFKEAIYG